MELNYKNLTGDVRALMMEELEMDLQQDRVYVSERLNTLGASIYVDFLKRAIQDGTDETLCKVLKLKVHFHLYEPPRPKDKERRKMAKNANEVLALGEFIHYYVRALCRAAIDQKIEAVEYYRAKDPKDPKNRRPETEELMGTLESAKALLERMRARGANLNTDPRLPGAPNSGLCVFIPDFGSIERQLS